MNERSYDNQPDGNVDFVRERPKNSFWMEIIKFTFVTLIIVVPFRLFVAQPFIVSGASMDPTFTNGEYLIVDQLSKYFKPEQREEVVIFRYPEDPSKFFIKRIIGLPGETVKIRDGVVTIYNADFPEGKSEGITLTEPYVSDENKKADDFRAVLSDDEYFVLGDNRLGSFDSRSWGPVSKKMIMGRPFVRLLPISKINFLPGDFSQ